MSIRTSLLATVVFVAFTASAAGIKKPITVHDLIGEQTPAAPQPMWRPDGKAFAYRDKGKILLYDIGSLRATEWFDVDALEKNKDLRPSDDRVFSWQNRRVSTSGIQWFADCSAMLVPVKGGLYVMDAHKSKPRVTFTEIGEDNVPTLSPDGQSVLFRKNFNLYVMDLKTRLVRQLTSNGTSILMNGQLDWVYPEELELGTAFWWSPDSKYIAYMQFDVSHEFMYPHEDLLGERAVYEPQRFPQAGTPNALVRIGVIPAKGGSTTWLQVNDSADSLLARVAWLPDSAHLAIQRMNRVQNRLELLLANATDGGVRTLLTETDKYWVNVSNDLQLLRHKPEFVWSSERSGFRHLYLYSLNGELERQLTSGEWPVRRVLGVDEEARMVYFASGQDNPLEDQLYRVSLDEGPPQRVSSGSGNHSVEIDETGRHYLDTFSNLQTAPETTLHDAAGKQLSVFWHEKPVEENFEVLPSEIVSVPQSDGTLLYARLVRPVQFKASEKCPAVVIVYGGPQAQAVRNQWTRMGWDQVLAHRGFVVWQLDNRGSAGRGHRFESPVYHEMGRTELEDQRAGVTKLLSMGFVDPQRIGIYGWSYGGYMTLYSLLHAPDVFRAGIAGAPVTDWHNYDTIYTERYMGLPEENKEGYKKSSDVLAAANLKGKLMIVCNFEDDNVLFQNTMQMMTALHRADKQFEFMLFPQKTHGVTGDMRESMWNGMTDFFERTLKSSRE
jgi:dipeptidyl-peptidase-4